MAMRPDPTFYPSPKLAMEGPPEEFAYTALLSADSSKPDALAVIDVKPGSPDLQPGRPHGDDASQGRRVPPFRLERLLVGPVAAHRPRLPRAALPDHSGHPLVAHLCGGHEAASDASEDPSRSSSPRRYSKRPATRGPTPSIAGRKGYTSARSAAAARTARRDPRRLHHGLRNLRGSRPLGDRPRTAEAALRFLVEPAARLHGVERMGAAAAIRERDRRGRSARQQIRPPSPFLGSARPTQCADDRSRRQSSDGAGSPPRA